MSNSVRKAARSAALRRSTKLAAVTKPKPTAKPKPKAQKKAAPATRVKKTTTAPKRGSVFILALCWSLCNKRLTILPLHGSVHLLFRSAAASTDAWRWGWRLWRRKQKGQNVAVGPLSMHASTTSAH